MAGPGAAFAAASAAPPAPAASAPAPGGRRRPAPASSARCARRAPSRQAQQTVETELSPTGSPQLDTLIGRVNGAAALTRRTRPTLLADLTQTELPGIQALQSKVPGDTTCPQLRQDAHEMVYDYRVYMVMTPQDRPGDRQRRGHRAPRARSPGSSPTISGWIQYAQATARTSSDAQAAFADYQAKVTAAQGLTTAGQSATLLAQTPQGYPGNASVIPPGPHQPGQCPQRPARGARRPGQDRPRPRASRRRAVEASTARAPAPPERPSGARGDRIGSGPP